MDRIQRLIEQRINEAVEQALAKVLGSVTESSAANHVAREHTAAPERPTVKRERRTYRPAKAYRFLTVKRGRNAGERLQMVGDHPAAYVKVLNALQRSRKPMSMREIHAIVGGSPKTVESALYYFRHNGAKDGGLIESFEL